MDKLKIYTEFKNEVRNCSNCDLASECNSHVVGQGNLNADLFIVCDAPREHKTITSTLKLIGLTEDNVYATNVVLCKTLNNINLELYEIKKCQPYLKRQIELVRPKLIITFGRLAIQAFINNFKITRDHGNIIRSPEYNIDIFPIYHHAYYKAYVSAKKRAEFKADLNKLKKLINRYSRKAA